MSDLSAQIRQALAELELVSHAPIQGYNYAPPAEGRKERWRTRAVCVRCRNRGLRTCEHQEPVPHLGQHSGKSGDTKAPMGTDRERPHGLDEAKSLRESYHGKTLAYFRAKRARNGDSDALLAEIRETTEAWLVVKIPKGQPPAITDPQWKRYIAESPEGSGVLATRFSVTREYIRQVRRAYRGEAA